MMENVVLVESVAKDGASYFRIVDQKQQNLQYIYLNNW